MCNEVKLFQVPLICIRIWCTHSETLKSFFNLFSPEYFEKVAFKKKAKDPTLNGYISKSRTNSESKLKFSESSFNVLQNSVVFRTLYPRGYTARSSTPYNPRCRYQWLAGLKELKHLKYSLNRKTEKIQKNCKKLIFGVFT